MQDLGLIFRPAKVDDLDMIWNLLHAVSMAWGEKRIMDHISGMYLLFQGKRLLGVLEADPSTGGGVLWSAVHPIYPEKQTFALMSECFSSLQLHFQTKPKHVLKPIPLHI